ncbi:serine hydrolase [Pontimonas sp.]|uniref:serine hydrolase domain-containing protein n=1 Tax=Pontimonas sp. TaxID=2304492 RepID=UPI0028706338|nr:serine hydrolase [Pontimonas sp.]MDR9434138.1 serine hydrolase [Pontimonas sp.]
MVPVTIFALVLAATPFSQVARGVMFGIVFWDGADIEHIRVFPANDIPSSSASELPHGADDTALKALEGLDLRPYILDQPLQAPLILSSEDDFDQFLTDSKTTAFLIVRDGVLVTEWYAEDRDPDALHNSFSVTKSVMSTTIGMAIEDGHISSINDPITDYVPELLQQDPRFGDITLRHLITMTSGIAYDEEGRSPYADEVNTYFGTDLRRSAITNPIIVEEPGQTWLYNNYNPQLLGMALERATGTTISEYMSQSWWGPMGAEADASWSVDSFYNRFEQSAHGFNARPRDLARFGLMFANGGIVDGEQVVPRDWVDEATAPTNVSIGDNDFLEQNYNYFWWVLPDGRYFAQGHRGQYVFVSPDDNTVIVRMGRDEGSTDWPSFLSKLSDQIASSGPSAGEAAY